MKKRSEDVISDVGTNNTWIDATRSVLDTIVALKSFTEAVTLEWNVSFCNLFKRADNINAASIVEKVNELSFALLLDIVDNSKIGTQ